jgi:phage-related protein
MAKGETVKYIIDADTSGFTRGMTQAATESDIAGKKIDRNLSRTARSSENNFQDIRRNAATAASSIRNFGVSLQALNTTSLVVGITALAGAFIELAGALSAASSTAVVLVPIFAQGAAGVATYQTAIFGLDDAFSALAKNDPEKWAKAMIGLSPAAASVAKSAGSIYQVFKSVRINTQEALWSGFGETLLNLGAEILPVINNGMQIVARSMNGALNEASKLASTPLFRGTLATVFNDTAQNINILKDALGPVLSIFTSLYSVTRPYVNLLAEAFVNLTKNAAAYLGSARGQASLNIAIQEGLIALKQLGSLVGSVFGLLTSLFRTSVNAGNALIPTLTGIIQQMTAWVNSAEGQRDLIALFNFTSLTIQAVANAVANALGFFFGLISAINSLSPALQSLIVNFIASSLVIRPLVSYISQLYLAIRVVAVTLFNFAQQAIVVFTTLGAVSSIVLVAAAALIALAAIIRGPLGGALLIIGVAIATYVGLSYLAARASQAAATSFYNQGFAAIAASGAQTTLASTNVFLASTMYNVASASLTAGGGLSFAAKAAIFLNNALLGLVVLAAGVVVILSILGVFGSSAKKAESSTKGFGSSLTGLQNAMKGVSGAGKDVSDNGLAALNTSLSDTANSADVASGSLAAFDKMNVLSEDKSGIGISGLPTLPNIGNQSLGAPTLETGAFDKAIEDMQKNFEGLQTDIAKPITNPFAGIGEWINTHLVPSLIIFGGILAVVIALFATGAVAIGATTLAIGLIVLGVIALIAIIILLVKNWDKVWEGIKNGAQGLWNFLQQVWDGIVNAVVATVDSIGKYFSGVWDNIVLVWGAAVTFFQGIFDSIVGVFTGIGTFFANAFSSAWTSVKNAFSNVTGFFQGVWNTIVGIFGAVGTAIGTAIGNAFKSVINTAIDFVADFINGTIKLINGAVGLINKIPGVNIKTISTITLPKLAKGGIVSSPTVAQLGESGQEAVVPLENNTEWLDKLASKINNSNNSGMNNSSDIIPVTNEQKSQSNSITINVSGVFATSAQEQKKIADIIAKQLNSSLRAKGLQGAF